MRCSEPGEASRLQSTRPVRRVAELVSLGHFERAMSYQLSGLHRFTLWRFRRRIRGGVADGASRESVLAKLGEPKRRWTEEGRDIWDYDVGQTRELDVSYSVSFDGDRVCASWWSESSRTPRKICV
jgi:hypothetical protein